MNGTDGCKKIFVLSDWRVLGSENTKWQKLKKAVYLRFERISRKRRKRVLCMSKKCCNFAVALCALAELICNNNYNNIVQQLFRAKQHIARQGIWTRQKFCTTKIFENDNSDNVALESILLERSGNIINIANTKFKNDNSDNVALESYGKANRSSEGR